MECWNINIFKYLKKEFYKKLRHLKREIHIRSPTLTMLRNKNIEGLKVFAINQIYYHK